jgi:hypothetical protein
MAKKIEKRLITEICCQVKSWVDELIASVAVKQLSGFES